MARTELPNGVILPAEYSDDWYEDMTSNLTKLDDVIGSDSEKLNADGVYFLRMSSAALTDSGTGNFSDLNSSYKIKTGDLVLDSGRKLYQIVSVDSTNSTFSVGNSLFKVTAESDLAPVAESGDYDDLDNKPDLKPVATSGDYGDLDNKPDLNPYDQHLANTDIHVTAADKQKWNDNVNQSYVLRYANTSVTPSSTISYSVLNNTDNIKAGDSVIDSAGQVFLIASVDSANQTVTVSAVLLTLALDANVMHLSGNETVAGIKTFSDIPVYTMFDGIRFRCSHNSSAYITFSNQNQANPGSIIFSANDGNVGTAFHLVDKTLIPYTNGDIDLGTSSRKWKTFNGLNPGALSFPDLSAGIDISGYLDTSQSSINTYTPVVDGWISIKGRAIGNSGIVIMQGDMCQMGYTVVDFNSTDRVTFCMLPVTKNVQVTIWLKSVTTLDSAKFFPCLGNV